jgi:uncharacterized surface protein with fasciclin (FAS1) repeats
MRKISLLCLLVITLLSAYDCKKEDIYGRPSWLAGKLFTQIEANPELSEFAKCVIRTGYDSVINISGSYTVFAPNNDAFALYFQEHPQYNSIEEIPLEELSRIVKFHIVQNPWSAEQLRQLDVYGWIDSLDLNNDEPRGYKRETLLREKNTNYGINVSHDPSDPEKGRKYVILDTLQSNWHRRQATDSRKFAPLFYKEYFDIYKLNSEDFAFYFNRPFEAKDLFFVNAKVVTSDIFAENGFVHIIDRVVEPLQNAYQILNNSTNSYKKFLDLVNNFPEISYNEDKTYDQPGADLGYAVDSLFDITYPDLTFAIVNEKTLAPRGVTGLPSNVTIRYHHGLVAPTDAAMDEFIDNYLVGPGRWGSLQQAPSHIRKMIINSQMASGPLYPSNFDRGFLNGESDLMEIDQSTIIEKKYASNSTFIGVNRMLVPKVFTSVAGPVYLRRGYSRVMNAIRLTGLLAALKRQDASYMLFVENDANLAIDSSLIYDSFNEEFAVYNIKGRINTRQPTTLTDIRNLILNHIALDLPNGNARKEFIRNLAGNYIVVNNETGEVRGSGPTSFGYQGPAIIVHPQEIAGTNAYNGKTYDISNWFNFTSATIYNIISSSYPAFHNLLLTAGLANVSSFSYTFMSPDENYTVFVPTDDVLAGMDFTGMSTDQLRKFIMMHFIQGSLIFTDGRNPEGYYETARIDEKSTQYSRIYTKVYITPTPDAIHFRGSDGTTYLSVNESNATNRMAARIINPNAATTFPTLVTNGVLHEINDALIYSELDTE